MTPSRILATLTLTLALSGCVPASDPPAGTPGVASVAPTPEPAGAVREAPQTTGIATPPPPKPLQAGTDTPPPPAPVEAGPPVAIQDAAALLESWRRKVRADGPGRELDLARSHLLSGEPLKAHELLAAIDPKRLPSEEARISWRLAEAEALSRLGEAAKATDLLQEAERALRPLTSLKISGECFSADLRGRQKIEAPRFRPGQTVFVYLDVDRLTVSTEGEGKEARTQVGFDLTLLEPSGREVFDFSDWERDQGVLKERMHRPWEDHAYRLSFRLPKGGVNLGSYVLKVEVTDLASPSPRKTVVSLPLTLE